jgi:uncharacterized membrane protein YbaN (DUF454 family)
LYVGLAGACVVLGALGIVLPGLPTTPFILCASYFLVRSSPRLHRKLIRSRTFGPFLRDWHRHRGIRRELKWKVLALITITLAFTVAFGGLPWFGRMGICGIGAVGMLVVWRLPNIPPEERIRGAGAQRKSTLSWPS